jgi:hypothetical protein
MHNDIREVLYIQHYSSHWCTKQTHNCSIASELSTFTDGWHYRTQTGHVLSYATQFWLYNVLDLVMCWYVLNLMTPKYHKCYMCKLSLQWKVVNEIRKTSISCARAKTSHIKKSNCTQVGLRSMALKMNSSLDTYTSLKASVRQTRVMSHVTIYCVISLLWSGAASNCN